MVEAGIVERALRRRLGAPVRPIRGRTALGRTRNGGHKNDSQRISGAAKVIAIFDHTVRRLPSNSHRTRTRNTRPPIPPPTAGSAVVITTATAKQQQKQ